MTILICGDREWVDRKLIRARLSLLPAGTTIVHGAARGADTGAGKVAAELGLPIIEVPADWQRYGKAAGPLRNQQMLDFRPDLVIAFHDYLENSKGTKDMVGRARKRGIPVEVVTHDDTYELP